MITKEQREAEFRAELQSLLKKHEAELKVTDDGRAFGMHSGVCTITMPSIYEGLDLIKYYCEFNL